VSQLGPLHQTFGGDLREQAADVLANGGFLGGGGETASESHRSWVEHYSVDRQPMIAHPLGGPYPGPHCRLGDEGVQ
jgi:hypothetical protein